MVLANQQTIRTLVSTWFPTAVISGFYAASDGTHHYDHLLLADFSCVIIEIRVSDMGWTGDVGIAPDAVELSTGLCGNADIMFAMLTDILDKLEVVDELLAKSLITARGLSAQYATEPGWSPPEAS